MASFHLAIFGTDQRSLCGEAEPGDLAASMRTFQASLVDCRACLSAAIRNESGALARLTTLIEHENFALRSQRDSALADVARLTEENERLALRVSEIEAFMDAAQAAIVSECVGHVELNGHIDTAEELRDWLSSEAFDGETGGKLADYIHALGIVIEQFDKQRRRANWHEAGYKAGKQKVVDYAVEKATNALSARLAEVEAECERMRTAMQAVWKRLLDSNDADQWELASVLDVCDFAVNSFRERMSQEDAALTTPPENKP